MKKVKGANLFFLIKHCTVHYFIAYAVHIEFLENNKIFTHTPKKETVPKNVQNVHKKQNPK